MIKEPPVEDIRVGTRGVFDQTNEDTWLDQRAMGLILGLAILFLFLLAIGIWAGDVIETYHNGSSL